MYQLTTLAHLLAAKCSPDCTQKPARLRSVPTQIDCPNTPKQVQYKH